MSIRIYIGNLPQGFIPKELDSILKSVSDSIRFKAVLDKETKECRGFGFATTNNEQNANLIIEKLNGFEFNGSKLRVELSEKKDSSSNKRNNLSSNKNKKRKDFKKIVEVVRNDKIDGQSILRKKYDKIVISPGPGNPNQAGNCLKIVKEVHKKIPILDADHFSRELIKPNTYGYKKILDYFGNKIIDNKSNLEREINRKLLRKSFLKIQHYKFYQKPAQLS